MSSIKILANFPAIMKHADDGLLYYHLLYRLTEPVGGVFDGEAIIPVGDETESEANALIQQAIAAHATIGVGYLESFTANDVRGGRL